MDTDKKTAIRGGHPPLVSGLANPIRRYGTGQDQDTPDILRLSTKKSKQLHLGLCVPAPGLLPHVS